MKKIFAILISILISLSCAACSNGSKTLSLYVPDGAPALAVTPLINSNLDVSVNVIGTDSIAASVTGENPKADVAILPINLAAKLLGSGEKYKMLGTVTHGNFYFLAKEGELSLDNYENLIGLTVGVIQLANIPGLTLKASLNSRNLPYKELVDGAVKDENTINLKSITASEVAIGGVDVYMLPSPLADIKEKTTGLEIIGSLQELYGGSFPQAVIVAKASVLKGNKAELKAVINKIKESKTFLESTEIPEVISLINSRLESGLTPTFTDKNLSKSVISNCNVWYESSQNGKQKVINFTQKVAEIAPNSILVPSENFFISEEL